MEIIISLLSPIYSIFAISPHIFSIMHRLGIISVYFNEFVSLVPDHTGCRFLVAQSVVLDWSFYISNIFFSFVI